MQIKTEATVVEINVVEENKMLGIEKVVLKWLDIIKIPLTVA